MKNYIPQNKFDIEAVERLRLLPFESVQADVPQLLEWLQDGHWPVAPYIADYLRPHVNEIKSELLEIFNTDDDWWKHGIMAFLMMKSPERPDLELMAVVKRIAEHPLKNEAEEGIDDTARRVLAAHC